MIISNPKKPLEPAVETSKADYYCNKIAPYTLLICIFVLIVLSLWIMMVHGVNFTATEANTYQRLVSVVVG